MLFLLFQTSRAVDAPFLRPLALVVWSCRGHSDAALSLSIPIDRSEPLLSSHRYFRPLWGILLFYRNADLGRGELRGVVQGVDVRRTDRDRALLARRARLQGILTLQGQKKECQVS